MLKILQARLQQYMNCELPDVQAGLEKAEKPEIKLPTSAVPGAGERHSTHDKGHEEGGSAYAKAGSSFRSPPGNSRAYTPKPESAYFLLVLSPKPLTLRGALPHYLSLKKELAYSSS